MNMDEDQLSLIIDFLLPPSNTCDGFIDKLKLGPGNKICNTTSENRKPKESSDPNPLEIRWNSSKVSVDDPELKKQLRQSIERMTSDWSRDIVKWTLEGSQIVNTKFQFDTRGIRQAGTQNSLVDGALKRTLLTRGPETSISWLIRTTESDLSSSLAFLIFNLVANGWVGNSEDRDRLGISFLYAYCGRWDVGSWSKWHIPSNVGRHTAYHLRHLSNLPERGRGDETEPPPDPQFSLCREVKRIGDVDYREVRTSRAITTLTGKAGTKVMVMVTDMPNPPAEGLYQEEVMVFGKYTFQFCEEEPCDAVDQLLYYLDFSRWSEEWGKSLQGIMESVTRGTIQDGEIDICRTWIEESRHSFLHFITNGRDSLRFVSEKCKKNECSHEKKCGRQKKRCLEKKCNHQKTCVLEKKCSLEILHNWDVLTGYIHFHSDNLLRLVDLIKRKLSGR